MLRIAWIMILVIQALTKVVPHRPKPFWYGGIPSCPLHYQVYAVQSRAIRGKNSVVCVPEKMLKTLPLNQY